MIPVKQKFEYAGCFQAALASVLEIPLDDVPMPDIPIEEIRNAAKKIEGDRAEQEKEFHRLWEQYLPAYLDEQKRLLDPWLTSRGLVIVHLPPDARFPGWGILGGRTGPYTHAKVCLNGEVAFDPALTPEEDPFIPEALLVICPVDPSGGRAQL